MNTRCVWLTKFTVTRCPGCKAPFRTWTDAQGITRRHSCCEKDCKFDRLIRKAGPEWQGRELVEMDDRNAPKSNLLGGRIA